MTPEEVERDPRRRHRPALGHRLRHHAAVVRQRHRHPQGRHPRGRLRAVDRQGAQRPAARRQGAAGVNEDNITKDDVLEGLTAVVAVRLAEPQFEGQTKEVLGTPAASRIVGNVADEGVDRLAHVPSARREGRGRRPCSTRPPTPCARGWPRGPTATRSGARRRSSHRPCPPSWSTAAATTWSAPSSSSSRATARSAPPRPRGTPITRPCCRSAARSSTSRSRRSPTC